MSEVSLGPTEELAAFVASAEVADLPSAALEEAAAVLVRTIAAARRHEPPHPLRAVLEPIDSPPDCTVLHLHRKLGATYAAELNAAAAAGGLDLDGVFGAEVAAVAVVPACLAAAEVAARPGPDLLVGTAVGLEVALRIARHLGEAHRERGFSPLGSAGRLGAALGASRTLGHSTAAAVWATGFAGRQGAGPLRRRPRALGALLAGRVAADGLEAALLAGAELLGPPEPLEGRRGLFALEAAGERDAPLVGGEFLLGAGAPGERPAGFDAAMALLTDGSVYGLLDALFS